MSLDVEINSKQYSLVPDRDGSKISTRPVQQFVQPIRDTGRTRPEDVAAYESFVVPNLSHGFGRARINSDVAFDPREYRRFFNSTCDTRWMDRIYLPILPESATATSLDLPKASASFKGELNCIFEASGTVVNRQFTGSSTDAWENGGNVNFPYRSITTDAANTGATSFTVSHTTIGENRCLVAIVQANTQFAEPSTVTYDGTAMTKAQSIDGSGSGTISVAVYYLVNPTVGANDFIVTATRSAGGNYVSGDAFTINLINLTGIDQDNPVRNTGGTNSATSTSSSIGVTTVATDLVIDAIVVEDGPTVTVGAGQTERYTAGVSSDYTYKISTEEATTTTTTMSHSWSGSEPVRHIAVPFRTGRSGDEASVGLDLIADKTNLVALVAEEESHEIYTSSDGATWSPATTQLTQNLLVNNITSDEVIDGGLLASIGGELIALIWDEDSGTITAFNSTNAGVAWTDESGFDIASTNGPQGVAVYPDIDGSNKLYVGTAEGLYIVDTSPSTWTYELVMPMPHSTDNCRRMTIHEGSLWFAQGVDNDSPAPIYKLTVQGNSRIIEPGFGLSYGDGVPSDMLGPVRWMVSSGDQLFISVGGRAASRNARILAWNGFGWHSMMKNGSANQKINWFDVGSGDDGVPRLHYGVLTAATTASMKFLEQPLVNPRSGVTIKREADGQFIELPYYDLGMPHESKNFLAAHVSADDLTASHETIEFHYGLNGTSRTTTDLGDFTSSVSKLQFASGAGVSAKDIGITLKLNRNDSTNTNTPKIKDIIIEGAVVPTILYEHQMTIDLEQTAEETGQSVETVISNIESLIESVVQTQLKFGQVSKYVTLDRERSSFSLDLNSWDASGAPNSMAERTGTFNCVLVEKVAT